jgi:hypothetical protein
MAHSGADFRQGCSPDARLQASAGSLRARLGVGRGPPTGIAPRSAHSLPLPCTPIIPTHATRPPTPVGAPLTATWRTAPRPLSTRRRPPQRASTTCTATCGSGARTAWRACRATEACILTTTTFPPPATMGSTPSSWGGASSAPAPRPRCLLASTSGRTSSSTPVSGAWVRAAPGRPSRAGSACPPWGRLSASSAPIAPDTPKYVSRATRRHTTPHHTRRLPARVRHRSATDQLRRLAASSRPRLEPQHAAHRRAVRHARCRGAAPRPAAALCHPRAAAGRRGTRAARGAAAAGALR